MLILTYYRSVDPVVELLKEGFMAAQKRRNKSAPVERPYAGYLLFLFGSADEDIATWFARNLVALDSLTGSSLAGLVFAERAKIRVEVGTKRDSSGPLTPLRAEAGGIPIEKVKQYEIDRLVSRSGEVAYRPERELTAITYGADAVARELGLQADLPCIAVLDALPTEDIEIVRLRDYPREEIIHFLRELAAKFTRQESFVPFFALMERIHSCSEEIDSCNRQIIDLQRKRKTILKTPLPAHLWPKKAKVALDAGLHRQLRALVKTATELSREEKQRILDSLETHAPKIVELSRTISSLQYYCAKLNALDPEGILRLTRIIETHVRPYLPDVSASALDEKRLQEVTARLILVKCALEQECAGSLPDVTELSRQFEDAIQEQVKAIESELERLETQLDENRKQLEGHQNAILQCEVPRLQHTFRKIALAHGIAANARKGRGSVMEWLSGFIKADILVKLGEMVAKHYGYAN